jgi:hypothetical protein
LDLAGRRRQPLGIRIGGMSSPRSVGLAPVGSPFDRPQAEAVDADLPKGDAAGLAQLVQQRAWSCSKTPARAHSSKRRQQVVAEPQPSSLAGSNAHGIEVRAINTSAATQLRSGTPAWDAASGAWWWGWEQWLDALP